jgi:hypothetical protein
VGALPRSRVVDGAGWVEVWRPNGSQRRSGEAEADVRVEVEGVRKNDEAAVRTLPLSRERSHSRGLFYNSLKNHVTFTVNEIFLS